MKISILILILLISFTAGAQNSPEKFIGHWEGTLTWYRAGIPDARISKMQLKVFPADTAGQYTWEIVYGDDNKDTRPYILKPVDTLKGHWMIDEKNSILLDQYFIGGRLCGSFSVGEYRIQNCYWREGEKLVVEFISTSTKPVSSTGGTSEEIPKVESYGVRSYQKAILTRRK